MRRSLQAWLDVFLADRRAAGYSARTLGELRLNLGRLVRFLAQKGITQAADVTGEALSAYQRTLVIGQTACRRPLSVGTQAQRMGQVRTFFAALVKNGSLLVDPARKIELPRVPVHPPYRILTLVEVRRLLRAPSVKTVLGLRDRALLELMYSTGIRVGELTSLEVADIDLAAGELSVRRGKGGRGRRIPVGPEACAWVKRYLEKSWLELVRGPDPRLLFVSCRGRKLDRVDVRKVVVGHAKTAAIPTRVTPHSIRHAFATHLLRGKASLRHIQEMLGHAKLTTTQIYTRVDITDLKAVHRRCHPRGRLPQ